MNIRVLYPLSGIAVAAALAFAPLTAFAQGVPMMGGEMKGGDKMGGAMSDDMMKGCDMMGGGHEHMAHMMKMMHEKLEHAADRVAALKTELKITEAQTPAWNKFADAVIASAKAMEESMDAMHKKMESGVHPSLPEKLEHHAQMAAAHATHLNAIKAALDPLYASFSDEQKKLADDLRIGPMGVM